MCSLHDLLKEQASQGSFVAHGRQDVSTATIGRPGHPGRVRTAGVGVTIKQYFGSAPRTSRSSSFMALKDLEQLTQKIRDQLEESITKKVTRQLMLSFSQMQSQFQSQMQSLGLTLLLSQRLVLQLLVSAQSRVVVIPQETIQTQVTQRNTGYTSKKILPAWLPQKDFMRSRQQFIPFLCAMIKSRLVLRKLEMQMLPFLYPLKRFSQCGRHLTPLLLGRHIL